MKEFFAEVARWLWKQLLEQAATPNVGPGGVAVGTVVELGTGYDAMAEEEEKRTKIVEFARAQLGKPYQFGVEGPVDHELNAYDCSELVEHAYAHAGVTIPDGSANQRAACQKVHEPKPGDLGFLDPNAQGIGHVFMFAGFGVVIEARGKRDAAGQQVGHVIETAQLEIEAHPRFAGWYRHPDFARPPEDRA